MHELTPEISKKYLKLCTDFFKEHELTPTQIEVLIQQLEYEWHNSILIKKLMKDPKELKQLLEAIENAT